MARSMTIHPSTGLRYIVSHGQRPGRSRYELADYPGHIDIISPVSTPNRVTAFCDECTAEKQFDHFTQGMEFLLSHVRKHQTESRQACEVRNGRVRVVHPAGSTLWQAQCAHHNWVGRNCVSQADAEEEGYRHFIGTHNPTPDEVIRYNERFEIDVSTNGWFRARCTTRGCANPDGSFHRTKTGAINAGRRHQRDIHNLAPNLIDNPTRKDTTVDTTLSSIETAIELTESRLVELYRQREERLKLPAEPEVDAIEFEIQYDFHGPKYTYAARKVHGAWFFTGRETGGKTWDQTLELMGKDVRVKAGTRRIQYVELERGITVKAKK